MPHFRPGAAVGAGHGRAVMRQLDGRTAVVIGVGGVGRGVGPAPGGGGHALAVG